MQMDIYYYFSANNRLGFRVLKFNTIFSEAFRMQII